MIFFFSLIFVLPPSVIDTLLVFARTRKLAHKWPYTSERTLPSIKSQEYTHHQIAAFCALECTQLTSWGREIQVKEAFKNVKPMLRRHRSFKALGVMDAVKHHQVTIVTERRSEWGMRRDLNPPRVPFSTHVSRFQGPARPTLSQSYTRMRQFCTFL